MANLDDIPDLTNCKILTGEACFSASKHNNLCDAVTILAACLREVQSDVAAGGGGGSGSAEIGPFDLPSEITAADVADYEECYATVEGSVTMCATIITGNDQSIQNGSVSFTGVIQLQCDGVTVDTKLVSATSSIFDLSGGNQTTSCGVVSFEFDPRLIPDTGCAYTIVAVGDPTATGNNLQGASILNPRYTTTAGVVYAQCAGQS